MTYKEILRYLNEAYYDLDYGRSENAKLKDETRKYLNQSMNWLEELRSKLKKEIDVYVVFNSNYFESEGVYTSYSDAANYVIQYIKNTYTDIEEELNVNNLSDIIEELDIDIRIYKSKLHVKQTEFIKP